MVGEDQRNLFRLLLSSSPYSNCKIIFSLDVSEYGLGSKRYIELKTYIKHIKS